MRRFRWLVLGLLAAPIAAHAQLGSNLAYDGRVTVARLRYVPVNNPAGCLNADSPAGAGWGHDYPMSVQGLLRAATGLTAVEADADSVLVLTADDPELMKHPFAMLTEPGCWDPTETEVEALRAYLRKGGFLVVDDPTFGGCWFIEENCTVAIERFETWMRRVLPWARIVPLLANDPIFDGFFRIGPEQLVPIFNAPPQVHGIYLDNDPTKRLMVVANYWTALGHSWRYVDSGLGSGLEQGGGSYKLGLNYLIYGLSH